VTSRGQKRASPERIEAAREAILAGASLRDAAVLVGVSHQTVWRWDNEYGWTGQVAELAEERGRRAAQTEAAAAAQSRRHQVLRQERADSFGEASDRVRQFAVALAAQAMRALQQPDPDRDGNNPERLTKWKAETVRDLTEGALKLGTLSAIFVDKAQVLTDGETERVGVVDGGVRERALAAVRSITERQEREAG
jgi:hypothetical protein